MRSNDVHHNVDHVDHVDHDAVAGPRFDHEHELGPRRVVSTR